MRSSKSELTRVAERLPVSSDLITLALKELQELKEHAGFAPRLSGSGYLRLRSYDGRMSVTDQFAAFPPASSGTARSKTSDRNHQPEANAALMATLAEDGDCEPLCGRPLVGRNADLLLLCQRPKGHPGVCRPRRMAEGE